LVVFLRNCLFAALLLGISSALTAGRIDILVSIAPYQFLVERIGGERVQVEVVVPPGASPHIFEPKPGQMEQAARSSVFFGIGESFEPKVDSVVRSYQPTLEYVDLREGLTLIPVEGCTHCEAHGGVDGHIWLSPKMVAVQATRIAQTLIRLEPEQESFYLGRLEQLLSELTQLDQDVARLLSEPQQRILVSAHGAFGYLCRDYELTPLSVEWHGRDRSPRQQTELMEAARAGNVQVMFTQQQYNDKAVRLLAKAVGASVVEIDPYGQDLIATIRRVAEVMHG
jgi:zinc transport system substrate-binding protein